ncbi:MAG: peptidylprolyl isomerase [Bacteroidales bacterium]|nr:peptidylprolyl isomerase [Bacteroidales bacterium]
MKKITLILGALAAIAFAQSRNNIAEEVAWEVGDQLIYKSDIESAYQDLQRSQAKINGDPYCVIPERLAIEKLFLHQADLDTVEVPESRISAQVESQINYYIASIGSREKVESYFGSTIPEMREKMREQLTTQLRIEEVQRNLTKDIKTTPSDVRRYFDALPKDSIPYVPMQVEVQIISINPKIRPEEIDYVKAKLREISDNVNSGKETFSWNAIRWSEDPSSSRGGELGFMSKSQLVPEYAAVAFNLPDASKVSRIVETQYGYHIIQLIEKRGDRINTRHILLKPKVKEEDLIDAINRLDTLRDDIVINKAFTFEEAAPYLSQDKDTRNSRGQMVNQRTGTSRFEMSQLPQEIAKVVDTLKVGDVSRAFIMTDPTTYREKVAIVKLSNRIEPHQANLADDYQMIKGMYENAQKYEILKDWLERKINETYIRIEDGWRDCDFEHNWLKN